uniref:Huntingtin n=1 Tax=Ursus americanus TaxID=9643 RepID=A0A452RY15_URSAM
MATLEKLMKAFESLKSFQQQQQQQRLNTEMRDLAPSFLTSFLLLPFPPSPLPPLPYTQRAV